MDKQNPEQFPNRNRLVDSGSIFAISVFVAIVTVVFIWCLGLGVHRTLFTNSLLSVSVLSIAFLVFIVFGLYKGVKLKDSVGKVTDKYKFRTFDVGGLGDMGGCADGEGILAWIGAAIIAVIAIWLLGNILWFLILVFIAMLYWIFFRALRLIFKRSYLCKGRILRSSLYGLYYTILYNCWIYGIIMAAHYFVKR